SVHRMCHFRQRFNAGNIFHHHVTIKFIRRFRKGIK
uniref:Collagen alpha-1(XVIII) chain n=1 Tax=Parascaris univalens TaxID=6257 RepID=A0A915C6U1_PARUN